MTTRLALTLAAACLLGLITSESARAEDAPSGSIPFPATKTTTLRGKGNVYVIDGPLVIPKGVEISVELDTQIVGINKASIEVQGGLRVRGTQDHWVLIKNVDFSPTRAPFRGVHLDMVNLRGCRFVHKEGAPLEGSFTIENACMQRDCEFDFRIAKGRLNLWTITWGVPCSVRLEPPEGKKPQVGVAITSSLLRQTTIRGHGEVGVRNCEIKGGLTGEDVLTFIVDGCDISQELVIRQPATARFKGVKLTKCNMWGGAVVRLHRPEAPKQKKERVFLQKFYFGAKDESEVVTKPKAIAALVRSDSETVKPKFDKPRKSKHKLVNYDVMNTRIPMLGN